MRGVIIIMGEIDHGISQPSMGTRQPRVLTKSLPWGGVCNPSVWEVEQGIRSSRPTSATGVWLSGSTSVQETLGSIPSSATQMDDSKNRSLCKNGVGQQGAQEADALPSQSRRQSNLELSLAICWSSI